MTLAIEEWPVGRLHPQPDNPRSHEHVIAKMAKIIEATGFRVPIIARADGLICDGHLRWKAAKSLGMKAVPVIVAEDELDGDRLRAFRIAINRAAELADWQEDLLAQDLGILSDAGFDLDGLGFDERDMQKLLGEDFGAKDEPLPEIKDVPIDEGRHILVVEFGSERELAAAFEEAKGKGWSCKIMS